MPEHSKNLTKNFKGQPKATNTNAVIDEHLVRQVAKLAKIKLTDTEQQQLIPALNRILSLVGTLQQIPTNYPKDKNQTANNPELTPLISILEMALPKGTACLTMLPDQVETTQIGQQLLQLAPKIQTKANQSTSTAVLLEQGGYFTTPKVVGGEE